MSQVAMSTGGKNAATPKEAGISVCILCLSMMLFYINYKTSYIMQL